MPLNNIRVRLVQSVLEHSMLECVFFVSQIEVCFVESVSGCVQKPMY